jgi:hypothetical protein
LVSFGEALCDLEYVEDSAAETDMNVVMTEDGRIIEVQGTAEGEPFTHEELLTCWRWPAGVSNPLCDAESGVRKLILRRLMSRHVLFFMRSFCRTRPERYRRICAA